MVGKLNTRKRIKPGWYAAILLPIVFLFILLTGCPAGPPDVITGEEECEGVIDLPGTGQTTCYDSDGSIIPCSGTGQDGELQMGAAWPDPRFTDNSDGTITDNLTGLIWVKDGNLMITRDPTFDNDGTANDGRVAWQHALDYIALLNSGSYAGHSDWRLPNRKELRSLMNYEESNNAIWLNNEEQGFIDVQYDESTWSSTTSAANPDRAWYLEMHYTHVDANPKALSRYVLVVRCGQ
jgi:hypothetical protein